MDAQFIQCELRALLLYVCIMYIHLAAATNQQIQCVYLLCAQMYARKWPNQGTVATMCNSFNLCVLLYITKVTHAQLVE